MIAPNTMARSLSECNLRIRAGASIVSCDGNRSVTMSDKNRMIKFADDTYLIVPEECTTTCEDQLAHIQEWAQGCNLSLNRTKTKEIIFGAKGRRGSSTQLPAACPIIESCSCSSRHLASSLMTK